MGDSNDGKRKRDKDNDDDEHRKEKKSKRARTRSRSPDRGRDRDSRRRQRHSRSRSRERPVKNERQRDPSPRESDVKKEVAERKNRETDMLNTRTGGAYIPPARLRMMQAQITDKSSAAYQRLAWEALKKSIHGHINKINVGNIGIIIKELLKENIVRGRGLLCRSVIQAQAASPTFTNVYAALVAAVNSRFPNIGELLLKRLVIQFKRGFKRNDKPICISSASFIAHLVNQRVAHEILALELLTLLVETPTDDSVEVAIAFLKECGQKLTEVSSKGVNAIFEMLRNILHEGQLDKRVQYMIEVMFQVWKDGFKDHPALVDELELVPEEEQFTHLLMLDDATDSQDILNVFKFDDKYEENEQKYKNLSKEILGSDADTDDGEGSGESGSDESGDEEEEADGGQKEMTIIDNTETNLVALRRTIYLTINSSLDFEECAHKLMKMQLKPGQEVELCHMFLDCCAEQRTYEKFYGLLAQRFCNINRIYIGPFEEIFKDSYSTAHRLDTNRLRNVSKFFAHLLFTDSINWEVLECVKLNEEDTTSSSRIYIKILFQELAEYMGLKKLNDRLKDPTLQEAFLGIFPRDNPKNTRFSINFFTSIGLGGLTDELREHLKQMPKNVPAPVTEINLDSDSSSDSSSSSSSSDSSSDSSSSSESEGEESGKNKKSDKNKKTKEANKDKTQPTPQEAAPETQKDVERWGHQGFYETYGNDARRYEKEQDVFARPRDVRRNDERSRNREHDRRDDNRRREDRYADEESRRRDDRRRDDRNGDRTDSRYTEEQSRKRDDKRRDDGNGEDSRYTEEESRRRDDRRKDDRNEGREDYRRKRDDGDRDKRRRNEDESRSGREENDRRRDDKPGEREDSRKKRDDDDRDKRRRKEDESKSGRDQDERRRDDKNREKDDSRKRLDADDRDKRRKNEDESRKEEDSRSKRKEYSKIDESRDKNKDDHSGKKRKDQKDKKVDKDVDEEEGKKSRKFEKESKDKHEKERKKDEAKSKIKREDRRKKEDSSEESSSDEDSSSSSSESDSSSSSSEDNSKSKKRDKKRNKKDDDGWDIRREASVRRELPVGRYWDNK